MKLYNTLTRQPETLKPLKPGQVSLYTCGPTVYHYYHIGNLRNAVFYDTLKRALLASGQTVSHIMNITDVGHLTSDADSGEDKLQARAAIEGKTVWEVAQFYTGAFMRDMDRLGVIPPAKYVKATDTIDTQIAMIEKLLTNGFAYQTHQAIYFDVAKLEDYGRLSGQRLEQKEVGARDEVVTDSDKHHPWDFALWFFTVGHFSHHTMHWPSPWGDGFPGWHLECSAIIERELGETIDIHAGGVDHIGTHHPNEMAQSEAAHDGSPLAHIWSHNEFLMVDSRKMSKSLENTYTLQDVIAKGFSPMALRLLFLQAHYRSQQNFTWESLAAAQNYYLTVSAWADRRFQGGVYLTDENFKQFYDGVVAQLTDDLKTPQALAGLSGLIDNTQTRGIKPSSEQLRSIDNLFGLKLADRYDICPDQKALIEQREAARQAKEYQKADELRGRLRQAGIEIDDTDNGPRWHRTAINK